MSDTTINTFPDGYRSDNVLGALVGALADRYDGRHSRAQIAHAIAESLGGGDYDAAEDALWSQLGVLLDGIEEAVDVYFDRVARSATHPTGDTP